MYEQIEVPTWILDLLVLFDGSNMRDRSHDCDGDASAESRAACVVCVAHDEAQERYYGRYFSRSMVAAHVAEYDPERYTADLRASGRGHLVGNA